MRLMSRAATLAAVILLVGSPLHAQASLSVALGAAVPVGSTADAVEMGYNATVGLGIKPPLAPIGLRIEGALNSMEPKGGGSAMRVLAALANVTLSGVGAPVPLVYGIAGAGVYNSRQDMPAPFNDVSETDLGVNVGVGFNIPLTGFSTFLEARYHHILSDPNAVKFIPITVGLKF